MVMWPTTRSWTIFKRTLPQKSRSDVTYVVPVAVNCSYCTPDDGYGKYLKHVEWSCNKIKILVLNLVGNFVSIYIVRFSWLSAGLVRLKETAGSNSVGDMDVPLGVVCRQLEVSLMGWSLVQKCPAECGAFLCEVETSTVRTRPQCLSSHEQKKRFWRLLN
jgi:hypothetical protein